MTEAMIERMARAMFWQRGGGTWIDAAELTKASFRRHAWELLDEMREPTDEMKGACDGLEAYAPTYWERMIDAARAEYSQ